MIQNWGIYEVLKWFTPRCVPQCGEAFSPSIVESLLFSTVWTSFLERNCTLACFDVHLASCNWTPGNALICRTLSRVRNKECESRYSIDRSQVCRVGALELVY